MTPRSYGLLCSEFVCRSRIRTFKKTKQKDAALLCVTSGNEASNCCGGTRKRIPVSSPSTPFLPRLPWMPHANTTSISVVMSFVRRACRSFSGSFLGKDFPALQDHAVGNAAQRIKELSSGCRVICKVEPTGMYGFVSSDAQNITRVLSLARKTLHDQQVSVGVSGRSRLFFTKLPRRKSDERCWASGRNCVRFPTGPTDFSRIGRDSGAELGSAAGGSSDRKPGLQSHHSRSTRANTRHARIPEDVFS